VSREGKRKTFSDPFVRGGKKKNLRKECWSTASWRARSEEKRGKKGNQHSVYLVYEREASKSTPSSSIFWRSGRAGGGTRREGKKGPSLNRLKGRRGGGGANVRRDPAIWNLLLKKGRKREGGGKKSENEREGVPTPILSLAIREGEKKGEKILPS